MGAAGAARQQDPHAQVTVFTELGDVAYSPYGIPYVHGREIPDFDRLVLQNKDYYAGQDRHRRELFGHVRHPLGLVHQLGRVGGATSTTRTGTACGFRMKLTCS
jgi:hypothetical protein